MKKLIIPLKLLKIHHYDCFFMLLKKSTCNLQAEKKQDTVVHVCDPACPPSTPGRRMQIQGQPGMTRFARERERREKKKRK